MEGGMGSRSWCDLPTELLLHFLDRLGFADHARFAAVCKRWNLAAACHPRRTALRFPWLALPADKEHPNLTLVSPAYGQAYDICIPAPLSTGCKRTFLVGSSHGWLIYFEYYQDHQRVRLLNPFTERTIDLPGRYMKTFYKAIVLPPPHPEATAAAYDANWVVVAILANRSVAFCRVTDHDWSALDIEGPCIEIAFCKGFLYCLTDKGEISTYEICNEVTLKRFSKYSLVGLVGDEVTNVPSFFLVGSGSRVFLTVCKYIYNHHDGCSCIVDDTDEDDYANVIDHKNEEDELQLCECNVLFQVFHINETLSKWIQMKTMEGEVLFVGGGDSILMDAAEWPSQTGNCIYFMDDCAGELEIDWGVSSMDHDGSVIKYRMDSSKTLRGPAMWIKWNA